MSMPFASLCEIEARARERLDPVVYDFFAGGADGEVTLRENEAAFARITLLPRVLRGVGHPSCRTRLIGVDCAMPILVAPTAFHRLAHPEGEAATARGAALADTIYIASMASTVAIEEIGSISAQQAGERKLWFQVNLDPDLEFSRALVKRAERAGCRALVVSVDSTVFGNRERDQRNHFVDLPAGMHCENLREPGARGAARPVAFWPELSWEQITWLRQSTELPIVLKGILHPEDARLAVEHGIDAIVVSNHGGRQLDTVPATIELLPEVAAAVAGRLPIVLDGGIRRGTDVVKALALGATAVAIGRPILWGLTVAGAEGVRSVLETLHTELVRALTLCGRRSLDELDRDLVRIHGRRAP